MLWNTSIYLIVYVLESFEKAMSQSLLVMMFRTLLTHSFNQYLLSTYYVKVLGTELYFWWEVNRPKFLLYGIPLLQNVSQQKLIFFSVIHNKTNSSGKGLIFKNLQLKLCAPNFITINKFLWKYCRMTIKMIPIDIWKELKFLSI